MHGTIDISPVDDAEARRERLKAAIKAHPHAVAGIGFLLDLQKLEHRPPPVGPADVKRREACLARAAALTERLPIWNNPPLPEPNPNLENARWKNGGWTEDENGVAMRSRHPKHGPHQRRSRDDDDEDGDGDDGEPVRRQHAGQPKMIACAYPLSLHAAQKRDGSTWALGDALVIECSETSKTGVKDGSSEKLAAASKCLAEHGIKISVSHLRELRYTSSAFKGSDLRKHGITICSSARSPEVLGRVIERLPAGEPLTVRFVSSTVRSLNGESGKSDGRSANRIPLLFRRLASALKCCSLEARIAAVTGLMDALGLASEDLSPGRWVRSPPPTAPTARAA